MRGTTFQQRNPSQNSILQMYVIKCNVYISIIAKIRQFSYGTAIIILSNLKDIYNSTFLNFTNRTVELALE